VEETPEFREWFAEAGKTDQISCQGDCTTSIQQTVQQLQLSHSIRTTGKI
jgi:hypothetical protein